MTGKIILTVVLSLFLAGICHGGEARFEYTWKDAEGVLNITDFEPPDGAEILDIRRIPMPAQPPPARVIVVPRATPEQNALAKLEEDAAALRQEEADLRRKAAELAEEAEEQTRLAKKHHYKERYQRRSAMRLREAQQLNIQADALAAQAEALERQAAELR